MADSKGFSANSSSVGSVSGTADSRRCRNPNVPHQRFLSNQVVEMLFAPENKVLDKPKKVDYSRFSGTTIHPAQRRFRKKKHDKVVKTFRSFHAGREDQQHAAAPVQQNIAATSHEEDVSYADSSEISYVDDDLSYDDSFEVSYLDATPSSSSEISPDTGYVLGSPEDLIEFDRQFYERCRIAREASAADRQLDTYFSEFSEFCEVDEVPTQDFYTIPEEFSAAEPPTNVVPFGDVLLQRSTSEHDALFKRDCSRSNVRPVDVASVSKKTDGRGKDPHLVKFVDRQRKSRDFTTFPHFCPDDSKFEELCSLPVPIPTSSKSRNDISPSDAKQLINKTKVQDGTVIYCPQGIGKSYATDRHHLILDSARLPYSFRNRDSLRKIADSGRIVLTNRLRDCDERTVFIVPDKDRFLVNGFARSLKTLAELEKEYATIEDYFAVKFLLNRQQYLSQFLSSRMKIYTDR